MRWISIPLILLGASLKAQEPPPPPADTAAYRALVTQAGRESHSPGTKLRVRIRASDGHILVSQDGGNAWLADSARADVDSTQFMIAFTPGNSAGVIISDARGRFLSSVARESSVPLDFAGCDRDALAMYPAPNADIASGKVGFWLLTPLGQVGPTPVSPLLMPRSPAKVWFRLELIQ